MPVETIANNKPSKKIISYILIALAVGFLIFFIVRTVKNKNTEEEIAKGTLILNTDKSVYSLEENVNIGAVKIDPDGKPSCDANLKLTVKDPTGKEKTFDTQTNTLSFTSTCTGENNVTNSPDFKARFPADQEGEYTLILEDIDTQKIIELKINVDKESMFSLKRESAHRLNPLKADRYPMTLKVKASENFQGKVVDYIPSSFKVIWYGAADVQENENFKSISWDVDLKAGEEVQLIYEFQPPETDLQVFDLGKASVVKDDKKVFEEQNYWQVVVSKEIAPVK